MQNADPRIQIQSVDDAYLRTWSLPMPSPDGDKEERGRAVIIGGSREVPGAVLLAANAALHAGAGKVTLAVGESIAPQLALQIPESRVIPLPEIGDGNIAPESVNALKDILGRADAILIGPGMQNEQAACALVENALGQIDAAKLILDASAMGLVCVPDESGKHAHGIERGKATSGAGGFLHRYAAQVLLTPHAGEMARLTGREKEHIASEPAALALDAAKRWNATIALKGGCTYIAAPDGRLWQHEGGNIGLAVSGSGDTLAGIIVGLAARGATLEQACVWGVRLHARAGEYLAERSGPLGYLIRDLSAHIPMLMHRLASAE
ncbi:MAG: NAD(P)H-hydrate dehydratase [Burkholderiaceae bacterium]